MSGKLCQETMREVITSGWASYKDQRVYLLFLVLLWQITSQKSKKGRVYLVMGCSPGWWRSHGSRTVEAVGHIASVCSRETGDMNAAADSL